MGEHRVICCSPSVPQFWTHSVFHCFGPKNEGTLGVEGAICSFCCILHSVKAGQFEHDNASHLSLATLCDIDSLDDAKVIATNWGGGPVSIAIYIDRDYRDHGEAEGHRLRALFESEFGGIENRYELIIGILYLNRSDAFWRNRELRRSTPMMFKFPTNSLRNLAESQVSTEWLFNCDIDFSFFAHSMHHRMASMLEALGRYVAEDAYGPNTIFIVPAFEVLTANRNVFNRLDKADVLLLVEAQDIAPFHDYCHAQRCTKYQRWYHEDTDYRLEYQNESCYWAFEVLPVH